MNGIREDIGEWIIAREQSLLTADVRASVGRLRELLSAEFREIGASGACIGLVELLEHLPQEQHWTAHTRDWEFRVLARDIVQTFHRALVTRGGADDTYSRRTSLWRNESGIWRMVYHQGTRVEPFPLT